MQLVHPVIASGGIGSRLWPVSRPSKPKQFQDLVEPGRSMLQATAERLADPTVFGDLFVVCGADQRFMVGAALQRSPAAVAGVLLEPAGRNTAPALTLAALAQAERDPAGLLLFLPADHHIPDAAHFTADVARAARHAADGAIVTFGIAATRPETGYGYILAGEPLEPSVNQIRRFVEKPDVDTAMQFVEHGGYTWNSGMFLVRADRWLEELNAANPVMRLACQQAWAQRVDEVDWVRVGEEAFARCPSDSIDYAVMEHTGRGVVVRSEVGWSDIGSWSALRDALPQDERGNALVGDAVEQGCQATLLRSDGPLVVGIGLESAVVVATPDAVLVADAGRDQEIKSVLARLRAAGRDEAETHRRVDRPWGWYENLSALRGHQVKRILVRSGHSLSLQRHQRRAEHWLVVEGEATITLGDAVRQVGPGGVVSIALGQLHRLANDTDEDVVFIEVQMGDYLGEDDIERLEDRYRRA